MAKEDISPNTSIDNISGTITVKNYLCIQSIELLEISRTVNFNGF